MKSKGSSGLTDAQKLKFATTASEAKKNNPNITWATAFKIANEAVPEYKMPSYMCGPGSVSWVESILKKLGHKPAHTRPHRKFSAVQYRYAKRVYELKKNNPDWSGKRILLQTNAEIPESAVCVERGIGTIRWLTRILAELEKKDQVNAIPEKCFSEREKISTPAIETKETAVVVDHVPQEIEATPAIKVEPTPVEATRSLEAALIEAIVGTVKPIVLNILQSPQFTEALKEAFKDARPAIGSITTHPVITQALNQPKIQKKRILVVGLLGQQAQEIQHEWGKVFDLRMFDSNISHERIRHLLKESDKTICMTKFISHSTYDVMKTWPGLVHCNGAVTALRDILRTEANAGAH